MARQLKKKLASQVVKNKIDLDQYEPQSKREGGKNPTFASARTIPEMLYVLENDKKIKLEARVVGLESKGNKLALTQRSIGREAFLEASRSHELKRLGKKGTKRLREADVFATDTQFGQSQVNAGSIGNDFVPLLGGPFSKQLYYTDYLRMHAAAFFAYHHDPLARFICNTIVEFTLGRGFAVKIKSPNPDDELKANVLWRLFEEVNDLSTYINYCCLELSIYGELMVRRLPNLETKFAFNVGPDQMPPKGLVPRIRLIDPSTCWDIITYPEDISRVLAYVLNYPTQYQLYTGVDKGEQVPTSKYILEQVPADEVRHYKINSVSNEKRGRSELFAILGYLKRLRDSVNYSIISDQKASAWAVDTTIEGDQDDIQAYINDQASLGTVPPAGSEFVHTDKIKRSFQTNEGAARGNSNSFEWCLSMIAAGTGIPVQYFGTHLGGQTARASAMVSTEPFAKKIEQRQGIMGRVIRDQFDELMAMFKCDASCEVLFPEVVVQDRTQMLADLTLAETNKWISRETAATKAAKELQIEGFTWDNEKAKIAAETPADQPLAQMQPLTLPGKSVPPAVPANPTSAAGASSGAKSNSTQAGQAGSPKANTGFPSADKPKPSIPMNPLPKISGQDRKAVSDRRG